MNTVKEINEHYNKLIKQAETTFEINLLVAERNHKLTLLDLKDEIEANKPEDSDFECIGCSA